MSRTLKAVALGLLAGTLGFAADSNLKVAPESRLWIEGTSTVRSFRCDAKRVDGWLTLDPANPSSNVAELQGSAKQLKVAVPVALLECGNGTMNDHMRDALKLKQHDFVQYDHASHKIVVQPDGKATVDMNGKLTIAGTTKPITMKATLVEEGNGRLRVKGSKKIDMTEFGIQPPTLMFGTMKVGKDVTVGFDALLKP